MAGFCFARVVLDGRKQEARRSIPHDAFRRLCRRYVLFCSIESRRFETETACTMHVHAASIVGHSLVFFFSVSLETKQKR